jgi:dTDP-glucose 4,6-dehydratase
MRVLVTGGAGFIGSHFIRYLLKKYDDIHVVNLDKLTYAGNLENLQSVDDDSRYEFVQGDICDPGIVNRVVPGSDWVINFAAETHVDRSLQEAGSFIQTDVYGVYTLLECIRQHSVERFIQISTDEVYGSIQTGSFKETDELNPRNPYSASKAGGDRMAYAYYCSYGAPVIITRASNNFGPNQFPEKLIPLFTTNAIEGKPLPLYGDGKNVRDWLYVEDHCDALDFIIHRGTIGEVYNIGGGNECSNLEITHKIITHLGKNTNLIQFVKDRPGHDRRYPLDTSRLTSMGWKPKHSFDDALTSTIVWYADHVDWWNKIKNENVEFKQYHKKQYGS